MQKRRASVIREAKERVRLRYGRIRCESCGWSPPAALEWDDMLHGHHARPIARGGADEPSNVVVLCPTCHALAHRIWSAKHGLHADGCDPALLLEHLRMVREEPGRWRYWLRSRLK